jgi:hypothetical protein
MENNTIQSGDRLNVTLRGTAGRIERTARGRWMHIGLDSGMTVGPIPIDARDVTTEQIAPAGWPPRPGQIWKDHDGVEWCTAKDHQGDVFLMNTTNGERRYDLAQVWRERHGLTKVYPGDNSGAFNDEPPF